MDGKDSTGSGEVEGEFVYNVDVRRWARAVAQGWYVYQFRVRYGYVSAFASKKLAKAFSKGFVSGKD